ncbi:MAG: hypothetical protein ABIK61_00160 [candidate division WOR-3 bacterium]
MDYKITYILISAISCESTNRKALEFFCPFPEAGVVSRFFPSALLTRPMVLTN